MFITIEGIDGSGKSTLAQRAVALLEKAGRKTLWTREPGGWEQGDLIRSLLLNGTLKNDLTEIMLFLADRCEHVKQVIEPALHEGLCVVCERYCDSTRAYQCWGRGIERSKLEALMEWCQFPEPDLTIWLDVSVNSACERIMVRGRADRIESETLDFHRRVSEGFRALSADYADRFVQLSSEKSPDELELELKKIFADRGII